MDFYALMQNLQSKLPKDSHSGIFLKEKFEKLSEEKQKEAINKISTLELKSPALVFWLGNLLLGPCGVARFMIGDNVLGFIRLVLTIVCMVLYIVAMQQMFSGFAEGFVGDDFDPDSMNGGSIAGGGLMMMLAMVLNIINGIWCIVDLFLVGKKLRRQNLEKVMNALN